VDLVLWTLGASTIKQRLFRRGESLHAPHLVDLEVAHAVRRLAANGLVEQTRAFQALQDHADIRMFKYPHHDLLTRIWELRHNLTAYDAAYIALAEMLDAPLITRDKAFASSTGHNVQIELV
jgi:predicted nucleic acid-binding protein